MSPFLLDHIIILLPHSTLLSLPPSLTTNFTITPGGRHADNLTTNKLITFLDGSYVELIAFTNPDPESYKDHWWGQKTPDSIIDFAFTSTDKDLTLLFEGLNKRIEREGLVDDEGVQFRYGETRDGGRMREDGIELKWKVTFPIHPTRGEIPFFCHDVTDRSLRVPGAKVNTTHPSGVLGIKSFSIIVAPDRVEGLIRRYEAILGVTALHNGLKGAGFMVGCVNGGEGAMVLVRGPMEIWETKRVTERGYLIGGLVFGRGGDGDVNRVLKRIDLDLDLGGLFVESDS